MDDTYIREQREISKIEAENSLGNAWQEHVAGNPGLSDLTDKEYAAEADRFFRQARTELGLEPIEDNKSAGAAALKRHSHGPEAAQSATLPQPKKANERQAPLRAEERREGKK